MATKITQEEQNILDEIKSLDKNYAKISEQQQKLFNKFQKYNNDDFDEDIFATAFDQMARVRAIYQNGQRDFETYLKER